jgi:hypothetical protein
VRNEIRRGNRPGDRPLDDDVSPAYLRARRNAALRREVRRRKQRRRRLTVTLFVLLVASLVIANFYRDTWENTGQKRAEPVVTTSPKTVEGEAEQPAATPTPTQTAVTVPQHGTGKFTVAPGNSAIRGTGGTLVRYRVEVEGGAGIDPRTFAAAVDATLADPRGWIHAHQWRFQRVTRGSYDATVMLATPATTNAICATGGLNADGYTSCRTDNKVVINLARWLTAVPQFRGDVATYRQYVVDHEMGHQIGHGHVLCNGPGQPAPVMQQQTYGLQGCVPNAWPYPNGTYLTGRPTAGQ